MRKSNALPGLDLLVGFEAAARHLSFTKAGAELYRTQSAVSRQIKELEDQLGVTLFQRRHRALALTEPGHQLYAAAAQVLATMRSATERLRSQSGRRRPLSVRFREVANMVGIALLLTLMLYAFRNDAMRKWFE